MDGLVFVDHAAGIPGGHAGKVVGDFFGYTPGHAGGAWAFKLPLPQIASAGREFLPPDFLKVNCRLWRRGMTFPDLLLDTLPLFFP